MSKIPLFLNKTLQKSILQSFVIYGIIFVTYSEGGYEMELWTTAHASTLLPAMIIMAGLAVALHFLLRHKPDQIRMIPFHIISALLVGLEIMKQAVSLHRGYDLYHLPFHFCSLFIFVMPLMSLYRGKHKMAIRAITAALCTSVFLMMAIYPSLIYSAWDIENFFRDPLAFHTVVFHNLVVLACFLFPALGICEGEESRSWKAVALFMVGFCLVSATMAQLLQTNFNNFYSCNVPPLEDLRLQLQGSLGYVPTQALYVLLVTIADLLFVQLAYWLHRLTGYKRKVAVM